MKSLFAGIAAVLLTAGSASAAGVRDDVLAGVARCAGYTDDRTWLECFYGAAQPMRTHLGLPPAPQRQTRLTAPAPAAGSFGADSLPPKPVAAPPPTPAAADTVRRETLRMAAYSFDKGHHFTVTLTNGQVWRQDADDPPIAGWQRPAADYVVTIRRGLFGDYNLVTTDGARLYKVVRIR